MVVTQIRQPNKGDPGRVAYGYYKVSDGVMTMCTPGGVGVLDCNGEAFSHRLREGDKPDAIARVLTRKIMREVTYALGGRSSFDGPIAFPKIGVA